MFPRGCIILFVCSIYKDEGCGGEGTERQCCQQPTFEDCPQIQSREAWGARPPDEVVTIGDTQPYWFIHHTEGLRCAGLAECTSVLQGIQNYHMDDPTRGPSLENSFFLLS